MSNPNPIIDGLARRGVIQKALLAGVLALFAVPVAATTFSHDTGVCTGNTPLTSVGVDGDLLTEGSTAPVVAISRTSLGLQDGDEVDALSFGDDRAIERRHRIVFSVDPAVQGPSGTGTYYEYNTGTSTTPAEACGDVFIQTPTSGAGNVLAPAGRGYTAGTTTGNQSNAVWAGPNTIGNADNLDAFDYTDPDSATGVYFSLACGSPTLTTIGATEGDILYSDLLGGMPVIATLNGAGPANASNLGISGEDLDALNLVEESAGVIKAGAVGRTPGSTMATSSHLIEFSVAPGGTHSAGDILICTGTGTSDVKTPAGSLGLTSGPQNVNALETLPLRYGSDPMNPSGARGGGVNAFVAAEFMYTLDNLGVTAGAADIVLAFTDASDLAGVAIRNSAEGQDGPVVLNLGPPTDMIHTRWMIPAGLVPELFDERLYISLTMVDGTEYRDQLRTSGFVDSDGDGVADEVDICPDTPWSGMVDDLGRPIADGDNDCDVDLVDYSELAANITGPM